MSSLADGWQSPPICWVWVDLGGKRLKSMDLYRRSIEVILQNQADSGAYAASPAFEAYAFCWLRDGSFIAHAMDQVGEVDSASAFFRWVAGVIRRYSWKVQRAELQIENGRFLGKDDYLHTRFTLSGFEAADHWWDFQLDGYGTWLWALAEHVELSGNKALAVELADAIQATVTYLTRLWRLPNYDCWEEFAQYRHPYTLSAIFAGLMAASRLDATVSALAEQTAVEIQQFVLEHGCKDGRLMKSFTIDRMPQIMIDKESHAYHENGATLPEVASGVDASLIGVTTPYALFAANDPVMKATIAEVEAKLSRPDGGVYRYAVDSYYGGGEWVNLTAWLGWHYAQNDNPSKAQALLKWVEAQADRSGNLPEQVSTYLLTPERLGEWQDRWGSVATPLLWSHAMYLILYHALKGKTNDDKG